MSQTYAAVHQRLTKVRGKASAQSCPCGAAAQDWAYQLSTAPALLSPEGHPYSQDLDDYTALCRKCHHALDAEQLAPARSANGKKVGAWVAAQCARGNVETQRSGGRATGQLRRRCLTCYLVTSPGPMANHLRATTHSGYEDLK